MKEFNSRSQRSEHRAAEHIRPTTKPQRRSTEFQPPSLDPPGEGQEPWSQPTGTGRSLIPETSRQRKEKYRPALPPGILANPIPRCDGRLTFETVRRDAESAREKFNDATGDYLATVVPDRLFAFAAKSWHTESNPATQTIGALEGLCGWLQDVDAPLKNVGIALGLPSGGAAFAAGVTTNLVLAPITGPLDKAESYIEVSAVIFGLLTGGHGLVVACIKPLLHSQLHHLFVKGVAKALDGLWSDHAQPGSYRTVGNNLRLVSDAQRDQLLSPKQLPAPDAPTPRRQPAPVEPTWLCLAFMPKPTVISGAASTASTRPVAERDATKPIVMPMGDDAFLRTLPDLLRRGSITQVDGRTAQALSDPPRGRHFIVNANRASFGTSQARHGSQPALQHPGCPTGRCVPPGSSPCLCPCAVCRLFWSPK